MACSAGSRAKWVQAFEEASDRKSMAGICAGGGGRGVWRRAIQWGCCCGAQRGGDYGRTRVWCSG